MQAEDKQAIVSIFIIAVLLLFEFVFAEVGI